MAEDMPVCPECGRRTTKLYRTVCGGCYDRHWRAGTLDQVPKKPPRDWSAVEQRTEKACAICKVVKPLDQYSPNKLRRDGRGSYCRPCANARYTTPNREKHRLAPMTAGGRSTCRRCNETKPEEEFYWQADKGRRANECIQCRAEVEKAQHAAEPLRRREKVIRSKYGLTLADYDALLGSQGGGCAICGRTEEPGQPGRPLPVDHDHKTGRIRGILCGLCNKAIGQMLDNPELLRRAARYLETR